MPKKSFANVINPANMFISQPVEENPSAVETASEVHHEPAMPSTTERKPASSYRKKELKTRRLQLLMKPSLYDRLKDEAEANDMSINELISAILEKELDK